MFVIDGIGTATPIHSIEQDDAATVAHALYQWQATGDDEQSNRRVRQIYAKAGVRRRHSVLLESSTNGESARQSFYVPARTPEDLGPSTEIRMRRYEEEAGPLAIIAAQRALADAHTDPLEVTHLITVSCSGFASPGIDLSLINALGLPAETQRTHVGFMGCHGAINALRVAHGFAADPKARVLVCAVELCSLHHQYCQRPDQIVANALFADGAAALIGHGADRADDWSLIANGSTIIPDTADFLTWHIRDVGFQMSLSLRLPGVIRQTLRPWMQGWLSRHGLSVEAVRSWAIHPGGPKILEACAESLGLNPDAIQVSQDVLSQYGNMSSPTVLFILEQLRLQKAPAPCVMLAFGPGVAIEAALFVT